MKLYSLLQSFVNYANDQYHLEPLLRQGERTVNFRFGDECCSLQISRDYIELLKEARGTEQIVCLEEEDVQKLVTGNIRLQTLVSDGRVQYSGTYRTMLLVESMFHICKPMSVGA
ncbi:hypothetical protein [Bacillus paramycoides]|uniref:Uncharacterized protein n=1 Tax=Bacillus paramycoides TaxID=2026194 RepID=A0A1J9VX72_9BACI|nr:hypothetical protein [Bacillus paramycoides]PFD40002.1 hypothetical protein CN285_14875 [Bacillus cereus]MED0963002.1 hypothetical protein [Bacillus paramycoides]MED0967523.1 hypothetical protein [Bacillus paramycoides]MED0969980.1 hypothetical protein [Bacillus paramycoides]MED0979983.1 hypothetical protein [Bacillus paramycoides]